MNYPELAQDIVKKAQAKGADLSEAFLIYSKTLKIDIRDQKVESIDYLSDRGLGLRVIKAQRLGFAHTSDLDKSEELIPQVLSHAQKAMPDKYNLLPSPTSITSLEIFDPKILEVPIPEKIKMALSVEKAAYNYDPRITKTEVVSYQDTEYEVFIINSKGIAVNFKKNYCGLLAQVVAQEEREAELGFSLDYTTHYDKLDPGKVGKETAQKAVELLKARSIPSQKMSLIFDPLVGAQLLGVMASMVSSDFVQKGKSLLAGKIDQKVASSIINIIDNGRLSGGIASASCDGEGVATQETILIKEGVLRNYLYNTYTASKGGVKSTGNAGRGSFKTLPLVSPTNMYFQPGDKTPEQIIKNISYGLYITKVMGMHTANPISGDFSIGAAGRLIENGGKTIPVRGITIAGNLIEVLKNIEAVGNDLRFVPFGANLGSPTLCVAGLSVSGK